MVAYDDVVVVVNDVYDADVVEMMMVVAGVVVQYYYHQQHEDDVDYMIL